MPAVILASGSSIRRKMLEDAGVEFEVVRPDIDEEAEKEGKPDLQTIAQSLAEAKAVKVSRDRPDDWVIGSDSVVAVDGHLFSKPASREEAAEHLRFFSGKTMLLTSAVALARGGEVDWSQFGQAELDVRELSEEFIQSYLDARMARGRLHRRRVPDGGPRRAIVRWDRRRAFHDPGNAAAPGAEAAS